VEKDSKRNKEVSLLSKQQRLELTQNLPTFNIKEEKSKITDSKKRKTKDEKETDSNLKQL